MTDTKEIKSFRQHALEDLAKTSHAKPAWNPMNLDGLEFLVTKAKPVEVTTFKDLAKVNIDVMDGHAKLSRNLQSYFCRCCAEGEQAKVVEIFDRLVAVYGEVRGKQLCDWLARNPRLYDYYYRPPLSLVMRIEASPVYDEEAKAQANALAEAIKTRGLGPMDAMMDEHGNYVPFVEPTTDLRDHLAKIPSPMVDMPEERVKRIALAKYLMAHGANPFDEDYYGDDALVLAASGHNLSRPIKGLVDDLRQLIDSAGNGAGACSFPEPMKAQEDYDS